MAPLIGLLLTFAVARVALRKRTDRTLPGRIALAAMLVLAGVSHFARTEELVAMVPPMLPAPIALVYATGVAELVLAVWLLVRPSPWLGWALAAFFVALLPANVHSAVAGIGLGGHGAAYLWFRVPLQLLFIGWALVSTEALPQGRRRAESTGGTEGVPPSGRNG